MLISLWTQHVLVMRSVEDGDLALSRGVRVNAPQEIMRELGRSRLFEACNKCPLRVKRGEHMLDRAVLAAGVERLEDDED